MVVLPKRPQPLSNPKNSSDTSRSYTKAELRAPISIFGQFIQVLDMVDWKRFIRETDCEKGAKGFSSEDHLKSMVFAHSAGCASLREVTYGLENFSGELNHLGIKKVPAHSTLAYANQHRDFELFNLTFTALSGYVGRCAASMPWIHKKFLFKSPLFSIDSTTIDLSIKMFNWALYRTQKGGIKLNLLLEHQTFLPSWALVTTAKEHDVKILKRADPVSHLGKGSIICCDRGYLDFGMFDLWNERGIDFVCRMKDNVNYRVVEELPVPNRVGRPTSSDKEESPKSHVVSDEMIELTSNRLSLLYPGKLRLVKYWIEEKQRTIAYVTNITRLSPVTIAEIYKSRWAIESFFKCLKQNLKVKSFLGTSANAVKIQLYSALICIVLLRYWQMLSRTGWCFSNLLFVIRASLYLHKNLRLWLERKSSNYKPVKLKERRLF